MEVNESSLDDGLLSAPRALMTAGFELAAAGALIVAIIANYRRLSQNFE